MRQLTKLVCLVEYAQQITTRLGRSMDKVFNLVSFLVSSIMCVPVRVSLSHKKKR